MDTESALTGKPLVPKPLYELNILPISRRPPRRNQSLINLADHIEVQLKEEVVSL
jgi:hypothetical protein